VDWPFAAGALNRPDERVAHGFLRGSVVAILYLALNVYRRSGGLTSRPAADRIFVIRRAELFVGATSFRGASEPGSRDSGSMLRIARNDGWLGQGC